MTPGQDLEPSADPTNAADQMRAATERLRDRAWMVTPMTAMPSTEPVEMDEAV